MLSITIRLHGNLRDALGPALRGTTVLALNPGSTLHDVRAALRLSGHIYAARNGQHCHDWSTPVADGDELDFFRPVAGGQPEADN